MQTCREWTKSTPQQLMKSYTCSENRNSTTSWSDMGSTLPTTNLEATRRPLELKMLFESGPSLPCWSTKYLIDRQLGSFFGGSVVNVSVGIRSLTCCRALHPCPGLASYDPFEMKNPHSSPPNSVNWGQQVSRKKAVQAESARSVSLTSSDS